MGTGCAEPPLEASVTPPPLRCRCRGCLQPGEVGARASAAVGAGPGPTASTSLCGARSFIREQFARRQAGFVTPGASDSGTVTMIGPLPWSEPAPAPGLPF